MFSGLSSRIAAAVAVARAIPLVRASWRGAFVAAALGVSACSTNNVLNLRPEVDVGTTAALPAGGMQDLVPDDPYLQQADAARLEAVEQPTTSDSAISGPVEVAAVSAPADPGEQGDMASVQGAPSELAAPSSAGEPFPMSQPVRPHADKPVVLAGYPRLDEPDVSGPPPLPADEMACRRELKKLGVTFRELAPIHESASCSIDHPIKVSGLPGSVELKPAATLNCEMALSFAQWTKNELNPTARRRYWSRVKTIHQLSSYSCRRINGSHSMSEHSKGNALDVGRIELTNGKDIDVERPGLFAFRTRGFLNSVRADGCEYFTTVLGPGYNYDHRNHFHFDIMPRRNGRHACH